MAHQILVPFRGEGAGTAELTWAQRGIWRSIVHQGTSDFLGGVTQLPEGLAVAQVAEGPLRAALAALGRAVLNESASRLENQLHTRR